MTQFLFGNRFVTNWRARLDISWGCLIAGEGCRSATAWIAQGLSKRFLLHCTFICPELLENNFTPGKMSPSKTCKRGTYYFFHLTAWHRIMSAFISVTIGLFTPRKRPDTSSLRI